MKVYLVTCFYGGQEWDVQSIWSTRELAQAEIDRIKDDPKSGPSVYGYDLEIEEWEVDSTTGKEPR